VSEIMLQQTQVATVIPYYHRFLARFPLVTALAAAEEHDVFRLWEGLGYYRRARQMHAAAKRIVSEHGGSFPRQAEALRRLPGIGRYTAGAILSFAFDAREPILEANTVRLLARLLAFRGEPLSGQSQKLLWSAAESLLPRRSSGALNQALMELGSQVCAPRQPNCAKCPVASLCLTNRDGLHDVVPTRATKPRIEQVREAAVVIRHRRKVLLVQRAAGQRWAGLWDFPRFALAAEANAAVQQELIEAVDRHCNLRIEPRALLATLRHGVTRFRITLYVFNATLQRNRARAECPNEQPHSENHNGDIRRPFADQRWVAIGDLAQYALSTTGRKAAQLLQSL
jgi:A/G-specific adenine glycosylase